MAVQWYLKDAGSEVLFPQDGDFGDAVLIWDGTPDWVRVPYMDGVDGLDGTARRVLHVGAGPCVLHPDDESVRHYALDGDVHVCECVRSRQFCFYRPEKADTHEQVQDA